MVDLLDDGQAKSGAWRARSDSRNTVDSSWSADSMSEHCDQFVRLDANEHQVDVSCRDQSDIEWAAVEPCMWSQ